MARIQVNLVRNGVQYTLTDEAEGIPASEFATGFAEEIDALVGAGVFELPTTVARAVAGTGPAKAQSADGISFEQIVQIAVLPKAGGRADVEFWGNTHKQPLDDFFTCKCPNWKAEDLTKLFKTIRPNITEDFFLKAGKYKLECEVGWRPGKTNTAGNPYKNVTVLRGLEEGQMPVQEPELPAEEPSDIPF